MNYLRNSVYLCRAPLCKHESAVFERVNNDDKVITSPIAWQTKCGRCGCGSLDLIFQKRLAPEANSTKHPRRNGTSAESGISVPLTLGE